MKPLKHLTMKTKLFFGIGFVVVATLLISTFVFGEGEFFRNLWKEDLYKTHDGYVFDWYNVEQWEADICQKEAGVSSEREEYSVTGLGTDEKRTYSLSITLQAQYRPFENGTLYEVAWYIQPANTDIEYEVYTLTAEGSRTTIQERIASQQKTGDAHYWSEISDKKYTKVILKYLGPEGEKAKEYSYQPK